MPTERPGRRSDASPARSLSAQAWLRRLTAVLVTVCGANMVAQVPRALRDIADTDFVAFISASRLLSMGSTSLYSLSRLHTMQSSYLHRVLPAGQTASFLNPPLAAVVLLPLASLPPAIALGAFLLVSLAALAGASVLLAPLLAHHRREVRATVLTVCIASFPAAWSVALGQWDALVLLACAGAIVAAQRGRSWSAGLLLGTALVKPQLLLVLPAVLLVCRDWRVLAGFVVAGVVWMVGSVLVVGADGAVAWLRLTASVSAGELHRSVSLPGAAAGMTEIPGVGLAVGLTGLACAVVVVWSMRSSLHRDLAGAVGLAVCLSEVTALHLRADDLMLLAIPLIVVAGKRPNTALVAAMALSLAFIADPILPPRVQLLEAVVLVGVTVLLILTVHADSKSTTAAADPVHDGGGARAGAPGAGSPGRQSGDQLVVGGGIS